jgi:uncharacterized protein (TIGR03437 family)
MFLTSVRLLRLASASAAFCVIGTLQAQDDRILGSIDSSRTVTLQARVHPAVRLENDRGPVNPALQIAYSTLYLKPTASQQASLEKLLIEQQDPLSPNYHHWLTPEDFADRFGLSKADASKIAAWLESRGLKVNEVARGRRWIHFSGAAADMGQAFRTQFHYYLTNGEMHFGNATPPSIPDAIADVVAGIEGLDDYYPRATSAGRPHKPIPDYTTSSGNHYLAPDDIATVYDLQPLYAEGFDGTGATMAIPGHGSIDLTNIQTYRARYNLPAKSPQIILVGPDPGPEDGDEPYLDLEMAGAVARNANLIYIYAKSSSTAVQYAVDQKLAPVITYSYGDCEQNTTSLMQAVAQQANAEGITWMASSGDTGAAGCERQDRFPQATQGLAVGFPASVPEITAMGGTEFDDSAGGWWSTSNTVTYGSAISYIPEKAWNDSAADNYLASSNGGASIFFPKPWWQSGPGVPNDNVRDVPDIALNASWNHDGYYIYNAGWYGQAGTSASSPVFAGFIVLLNQYLVSKGALSQPGLGNINPTLYRLAQSAPAAFHDIVNGNNIVPCMQGTPDCANGSFGFTAGPGYDLVTGLGSIDAYKLATSWTSGAATSTAIAANPGTIAFNSGNITLTATVTAQGGTPAGQVSFLTNDTSLGTATLNPSGVATLTVNAIQLSVGANAITAVYAGGNGWNGSAGITTVTITAPASGAAIVATVTPDPVYEHAPTADGDTWSYAMHLENQSSVPATLTKFTIAGTDYTSSIIADFGSASIPANGSLSSITLSTRNLAAPLNRVFTFSGADANGGTWSQQISVPFITRIAVQAQLALLTPASVSPDSTADLSCRWAEPLVLEERAGYDVQLIGFEAGNTDFSSQLQQIFGTTNLAPYGKLQGTLCWNSGTPTGSVNLSITYWLTEFDNTTTYTTPASTTLASAASPISVPSVSPASVSFTNTSSATVGLTFSTGSPQWTATVSPLNSTTSWLNVSPASGSGGAQLKLSASSSGLANGVYAATVLIQCQTGKPQFTVVPVTLVVGGSSGISISAVTNAASYQTVFAPGMLMTVFGTNLAPATQHAGVVPLPLNMQGVSATVNGYSAPMLDVSPGQLNVQIPYETGAGLAILGVNNNGQVAYFPFQVQSSAPGIFMMLDGTTSLVPVATGKPGQVLVAFMTGEGDVTPPLITGASPTTTNVTALPTPRLPVSVTVGGIPATIDFAGIPDGLVGTTQVNFTIPGYAPSGRQPVVVTVGGVASAPVMVTISQSQ